MAKGVSAVLGLGQWICLVLRIGTPFAWFSVSRPRCLVFSLGTQLYRSQSRASLSRSQSWYPNVSFSVSGPHFLVLSLGSWNPTVSFTVPALGAHCLVLSLGIPLHRSHFSVSGPHFLVLSMGSWNPTVSFSAGTLGPFEGRGQRFWQGH